MTKKVGDCSDDGSVPTGAKGFVHRTVDVFTSEGDLSISFVVLHSPRQNDLPVRLECNRLAVVKLAGQEIGMIYDAFKKGVIQCAVRVEAVDKEIGVIAL